MRFLQTKSAKSKYPKSETTPYNPWAVCTESTGREDEDKYERCVQHIKDQNRQKNKGKKKKKDAQVQPTKPVRMKGRGFVHVDRSMKDRWRDVEQQMSEEGQEEEAKRYDDMWEDLVRRQQQKSRVPVASTNEWLRLLKPQPIIIEAKKKKKWMQDVSEDIKDKGTEGTFTEYCGGNVTEDCIERGKDSPNKKTRQRANLADVFRSTSKKKD